MIRTVNTDDVIRNVKEMCIEANHYLSADMDAAMKRAVDTEKSELGKKILNQLQDNLKIADEERIPICQDTGMAVIFMEVGQDVHFEGMAIEEAVNEGVRQGYTEGYLRKSVVGDPLLRENTRDNTPAVIHYSIVPGDKVKLTMAPKGFGSENMSRVFMLKPADGIEGVKNAILTAVKDAGPNACPPMVVGVGIGGTFEKCAILAKKALTRPVDEHSTIPYVKDMEIEMLDRINKLGIGPGGLGGTTTALAVNINTYPTHIAGLPVAVNICCHVNRHVVREI
ncbi:MAG: fumarate hydratase [Roseburia sp.]